MTRFAFSLSAQIAFQTPSAAHRKKNAATAQFLAIAIFGEIRLTSKNPRARAHRLIKGLMLKSMQRVVMNEDANRTLRWQQMRRVLNLVRKLLTGSRSYAG
jgi:hypothetical protein